MTANDARRAHALLDGIINGHILGSKDVDHLRSFLPERPKQKTLEEICEDVALSLDKTSGDQWGDEAVYLESWLKELHAQLQGLKAAPATVPALPAGMRIADHEEYGRCVASPRPDNRGDWEIVFATDIATTGTGLGYVHSDTLTFIDAEPVKPAHPEFLETEADYAAAPEGTIVAKDSYLSWKKQADGNWTCTTDTCSSYAMASTGGRHVLRWGWGK
ncbi:hypothetical protein [Corynebacterium stationis]|uniref:hypothetical protein n=1 Tax=Corynebacterium stationis TaxID=1705 RepID=UPI0028AB90A0|nr:hypothetical protein [Corynebacterium stationis]